MNDSSHWVSVARLIRPQGRRGEVAAEILTDFPERFGQMKSAFLLFPRKPEPQPVTLEDFWMHQGRVVLKFTGIDSISDAEPLRGAELVIPAAERMVVDAETFYIGDLAGCTVIDVSGPPVEIGVIQSVARQEKTADLLLVHGRSGGEIEIPFVREYLVQVDLPAQRVEMRLPAGLLDINAPMTEEERRRQE